MTDAGWAEKAVTKRLSNEWWRGAWLMGPEEAADMLRKEHARSVRIVKKAAQFQFRETDTNEWVEGYEAACHDILTALQRGRGGRG